MHALTLPDHVKHGLNVPVIYSDQNVFIIENEKRNRFVIVTVTIPIPNKPTI